MLLAILTSAAVASLVSAAMQLFGAHLERRARRRELLLARALDLAAAKTEIAMRVAKESGATVTLYDNIFQAEGYFRWLSHLMDHGELPPDAKARRESASQELGTPEVQADRLPSGRPRR